jgi:hypothetical protein
MCEPFGFSERVLQEAYRANDTSLRKPDDKARAHIRSGGIQDPEDGLLPERDPEPGAGA